MATLAIDTATCFCAAAIYDADADHITSRVEEDIGRGHAERLMDVIAHVMDRGGVGFDRLEAIAVTIGPGSFTGIRVGVAAARGFGFALDVPVMGTTTLESLAVQAFVENPSADEVLAVVTGGRGELFCQRFGPNATPNAEPFAVNEAEVSASMASGVDLIVGNAAQLIAGRLDGPPPIALDRPVGDILAVARAAHRFRRGPAPLYLRSADAKPQTGFALPRKPLEPAP